MQNGYEHCVPKKTKCQSKRKVLVFRHGSTILCLDNGKQTSTEVVHKKRIWFGPPPKELGIQVGQTLLSRQELSETNVHE